MFSIEPIYFIALVGIIIIGIKIYDYRVGNQNDQDRFLDFDSNHESTSKMFDGNILTDPMYSNLPGNTYYNEPLEFNDSNDNYT